MVEYNIIKQDVMQIKAKAMIYSIIFLAATI